MKITAIETKKLPIKLRGELKIAFASISTVENVLIKIETDEGITGFGEAAPFAPVTGETAGGVLAALELLRPGLLGRDPFALDGLHALMDKVLHGNGSAKCAVDIALYDIIGKAAGKPVYRVLGGETGLVQNGATIGIADPREMAREARHYVEEQGYRIIKVKVGLDPQGDIEALRQIREAVGDQVRLRADANQGYTITGALKALEGFAALGVDVVEQCLPGWDLEGAAFLRSKVRGIDLMLDESIHNPHDAARACRLGAADMFNIKLMKCGGLYPGARIAATAASFGLRCMVGCMLETRLALTAGLSLVAARGNITDADCDSFLSFDEKQAGVTGGFTIEDGVCRLSEEGGLGVTVDF